MAGDGACRGRAVGPARVGGRLSAVSPLRYRRPVECVILIVCVGSASGVPMSKKSAAT